VNVVWSFIYSDFLLSICLLRFLLACVLPSTYTNLGQPHSFNMTADASIYAPLTNAAYRAPAVKQPAMKPTTTGKKPWRETPLVESANLSEAAGWYEAILFPSLLSSQAIPTTSPSKTAHSIPQEDTAH